MKTVKIKIKKTGVVCEATISKGKFRVIGGRRVLYFDLSEVIIL
jgi:hypothetical protein